MSDLDGLLVVSLEHAVAAPYASCKLADAGARVLKIERPEGDFARGYDSLVKGQSAYFVWINRGKESICLDLKTDADRALLHEMLARADVFLHNLGPGVVDRLGFASDTLRATNPGLITCAISGYGTTGPAKDQKAYDLLIQAETGLAAVNGSARVGVSVCDIAAGMTATQAILQALIGRTKTGKGRAIEVSLFHAMADWMNVPYLQTRYGKAAPKPMGLNHPTIAPYGAFTCSDNKQILISIQNEREWARLCENLLQDTDFGAKYTPNSTRIAHRETVDARVAQAFATLSRDAATTLLDQANIAYGRLTEPDDLVTHPQHRFLAVQIDGGEIQCLAPGAVMEGQPTPGKVPNLDEHGALLRAEFTPH